MARRRKTRTKKERQLDPEEILEGRVEARVEDLFDLIHEVNPTNRSLSRKEEARRYAFKNRLQSLLVRRFGDEHLKVEPTVHSGVVSLEHISGARDACHAVIAELDPDARSWVRRQLDLAASGGEDAALELPALEGDDEEVGVDDLLERGRLALEEYDYERGEALLREAFAESRTATVPEMLRLAATEALLELQVDLLGMDSAALELEPRLSASAKERPAIRTLLALAAARLGDAERALELMKGLTPVMAGVSLPRAAAVYAALAARAIVAGDRRWARSHRERLVELDPSHPEIPRLDAEIARLRGEDFLSVEAELERRFRERGAAAVEEEARALAGRWPEGEVARRILRQAAAERREKEIAEHLELAEKARAGDRLGDAARHFQAAIDAGCDRPELPDLVSELADLARERRERREVRGVVEGLTASAGAVPGGAHRRDTLLAYLALGEGPRAEVRGEVRQPVLEWLEELGAPRKGTRAQAAAAALAALESARAAWERGEAQPAVDALEPHRAILRPLASARDLWDEAQRQIRLQELAAADSALERGRLAAARRHLEAVPRGELDSDDLMRAEDLSTRLEAAERHRRLRREHEGLLAAGDVAAAQRSARALARMTRERSPDEHRRWTERAAELGSRLGMEWRLEVVPGEAPLDEALQPSHWREGSVAWLDDDGRELVLANTWDRFLFIDVVDVERSTVTARISLKTPRPLVQPLITRRYGDRLWISGRDGDVLEIARDGWRLLGYYPLRDLLTDERGVDGALPFPDGRWVWIHVTGERGGSQIGVVDLHRWRLAHRLPAALTGYDPILAGEPRMLVNGGRLSSRLYTAAGELLDQRLVKHSVIDGDVGPDGTGLLLLVDESDPESRRVEMALVYLSDGTGAGDSARLALPEVRSFGFHAVVTSLSQGLTFVQLQLPGGDELLVFTPREIAPGAPLEPRRRFRWPRRMSLAHDQEARHVVAITFDRGFSFQRLDGSPEPPAAADRPRDRAFPQVKVFSRGCGRPAGDVGARIVELAAELEGRDRSALRVHLARLGTGKTKADADERVCVALALLELDHYAHKEAVAEFAGFLAREHPRHVGVRLLQADLAAKGETWSEVGPPLRRVSPASLDARRARHFHHLAGLAHLHGGRPDEAQEAFRRGLDHEGDCELDALVHLTRPMADPPAPEEWNADQPLVSRLLGAIRTADHALDSGDVEAARVALERGDVRWHAEVQIAARRAHAWLEPPKPAGAVERFRRRAALALYAHVRGLETWMRRELFLPGVHWDEPRLAELEGRFRALLEEL